ncbi:hypothetical protein AB0L65_61300 [Nonomuraea sp. NPDC052116]|uniref:phage integrase central domain-containing protein n=1 Tax=Nonomuraea sp. NPDC052116 TaxID=3155665 RepID=UPI00342F72DF
MGLGRTARRAYGGAPRRRLNKDGHRRFGNIRKLPSGRFQIRCPGPDGRLHAGATTYGTKTDADRTLTLIEAQMISGEWTDPDRGKIQLADYARAWIKERPGLRPKTVELYTWLLERHVVPTLGGVAVSKLPAQMIRTWRSDLLGNGVSVSTAAKAYRLLRAVLMTAVEEDKLIARNPCRIKGADNEHTPERTTPSCSSASAARSCEAATSGGKPSGRKRPRRWGFKA